MSICRSIWVIQPRVFLGVWPSPIGHQPTFDPVSRGAGSDWEETFWLSSLLKYFQPIKVHQPFTWRPLAISLYRPERDIQEIRRADVGRSAAPLNLPAREFPCREQSAVCGIELNCRTGIDNTAFCRDFAVNFGDPPMRLLSKVALIGYPTSMVGYCIH